MILKKDKSAYPCERCLFFNTNNTAISQKYIIIRKFSLIELHTL